MRAPACLLVVCVPLVLAAPAYAAPTGEISGTVTSASTAEAISGTRVCAKLTASEPEREAHCAFTGAHGEYTISGAPVGEYHVRFTGEHLPLTERPYAPQWYYGSRSFATSTPVKVEASKASTGIDPSLVEAASVSGTVTDTEGHPLQTVVFLFEETEPGVFEANEIFATTDAEGNYTLRGIGQGTAYIEFSGYCNAVGCTVLHAKQFYDGAPTLAGATGLHLKPAEDRTGSTRRCSKTGT